MPFPFSRTKKPLENQSLPTPTTAADPTDRFGLFTLVDPPQPTAPVLNIIFVHGLGGSAYDTWTHQQTKSFWPPWLSKVRGLENARIMTFGYDSSWNKIWTAKNVLDLPDFARQLVNELWLHYADHGEGPTLFVAHSMGGLVVKQALIAAHNNTRYRQIDENIIGIVFLGTPHRGADLAKTLNALLDVSFSGTRFVKDLVPGSQTIKEINELFADRAHNLQLASFWESRETTVGVVVPEFSATLGFPTELRIPLDGDHSTIVKYASEQNHNFRQVSRNIAALVRAACVRSEKEPIQVEEKFLVPYQTNPQFIGRTNFLQKLKEELSDVTPKRHNHRIALYGMGGIGKTQCALGYVYANRKAYDRIYWITAIDRTSLLSGYQSIANAAGLNYLQNAGPSDVANGVLSWLRQQLSWLLVIDNLDDIHVADRLLPENGPCKHTIITTRNPNAGGIPARPLEVPLLSAHNSINLLSALSMIAVEPESLEQRQAMEIVQMLGYLPLAIEQAGAYVREVTANFSEFLEAYERNHMKLHMWVPKGNRQYPNSIATTWSMSFSMLQKYPVMLLRMFSFLNPDGILIEFLRLGAEALGNDLRDIICDQIEMAKTLLELEKFSLIKWDRSNNLITIHRLVQKVVKDEMSNEELRSTATDIIDIFTQAFPEFTTNETLPLCRRYQGQIVEPLARMSVTNTLKSSLIRVRVSIFLCEDGKYDDSERLLLQAVEIYTSLFGTEDSETLTAMHHLSVTYWMQGRNVKATRIQEEVLEKQRRILGEEHFHTLGIMHNLASTYLSQGKNVEAARIQEEVLEKRRRILGEEHPDTLATMHALATTYLAQGKNAEAARIHEDSVEKHRRVLGEEHPSTLKTMQNLASTYLSQGKNVEAARIQEEVLEKRRRILGEEHPSTLETMHALATTYHAQGKHAEAARIHEDSAEKHRRILGEEHPNTLNAMRNLASTYWAQGRNVEAARIWEEVLEKQRRILGEEHPDTLATILSLATTYQAQRKYTEAARINEDSVEKHRMILGEEHPNTLNAMRILASTYSAQGKNVEAARILEEVLEKQRTILGEEHPSTLNTMRNLASIYSEQGRNVEAARIQEEALKKQRRILGEGHPDTLATMHTLATTHQAQGKHVEAARIHEDSVEKHRRILGEEHPNTLSTMHALATTYLSQGRNAEAARILEEVLEKRRRVLSEEHPDTLMTMRSLASIYRSFGRGEDATKIEDAIRIEQGLS